MWMNGSSWARSTPANARRTGKPSPSKPDGAVVTLSTGRSLTGPGSVTRGRTRRFSTETAGMMTLLFVSAHCHTRLPGGQQPEQYMNVQHSRVRGTRGGESLEGEAGFQEG